MLYFEIDQEIYVSHSVLEASVERAESERTRCEHEADSAQEVAATRQHQIATLTDLLDAAKAKVR